MLVLDTAEEAAAQGREGDGGHESWMSTCVGSKRWTSRARGEEERAMVSDAELVARLREFLRASDLSTTTTAIVRRRLEEDFGIDLSDKKAFIREQVDIFLHSELTDRKDASADEACDEEEQVGEGESGSGEEAQQEEEEEEEEGNSNDVGSRKRRFSKVNKEDKKRGGGFTKLCSLSPELQNFVGASELARTEVVKKLWAYIRENELQDPNNRRKIICDNGLKRIFNVSTIDMFQMNKALTKHIWPLTSENAGPESPERSKLKDKQHKKVKNEESAERSKPKDKQKKKTKNGGQKHGSSGLTVPLQLSDDLVKFIGTGETSLSRSDVVKRMWDYIKQNNLQDPADRRNIICDEKLKELFKVDSFVGFTVSKLLSSHFIKD